MACHSRVMGTSASVIARTLARTTTKGPSPHGDGPFVLDLDTAFGLLDHRMDQLYVPGEKSSELKLSKSTKLRSASVNEASSAKIRFG